LALPTRQTPRRALTASAFKLGTRSQTTANTSLSTGWQHEALRIYDEIGEFRQAAQFYARMMGKVLFFPATENATGTIERIESGPPVDAMNRIQDPGGGRSRLQYDYGRLMWITGEGVLFGSQTQTDNENWRFLWKDEVKIEPRTGVATRLTLQKQPAMLQINGVEVIDTGTAYRIWTPHPRHSDEADAPMRAIQSIAAEFLILSAAVRATATSRITAGLMVMPMEGIPSPIDATGDEDPNTNPFLQDYIEHVTNSIENPGSPEARTPYLYTPPYDYADEQHLRWMPMHDASTDYLEQKLREELLGRAAIAFDMPPEAFKGMADANHWTAKQVMHDMWISHGVPVAQRFADDLSDAYLRPYLRDAGYPNWQKVVVGFDDSQVVISPDRSQQALEALQWGVIGYEPTRQALGYTEDAAPSDDDLARIIALKSRNPLESGQESGLPGQRGPLPTPASPQSGQDVPAAPTNGRTGSRQEALRASVETGAAMMALRRCRETAGARLRSYAQQSCAECCEKTSGKSNALVASILGTSQVAELGFTDPLKLVAGGSSGFKDFLLEEGYGSDEAGALARGIEVYAAKTLFEDRPALPAGFIAQLERMKEVSVAIAST
jgi:hypothetical protein